MANSSEVGVESVMNEPLRVMNKPYAARYFSIVKYLFHFVLAFCPSTTLKSTRRAALYRGRSKAVDFCIVASLETWDRVAATCLQRYLQRCNVTISRKSPLFHPGLLLFRVPKPGFSLLFAFPDTLPASTTLQTTCNVTCNVQRCHFGTLGIGL